MRRLALYADALFFAVVGPTLIAVSIDFCRESRRWRRSTREVAMHHALKAAATP